MVAGGDGEKCHADDDGGCTGEWRNSTDVDVEEKKIKKTFIKMKKGWLSELINTQQLFAM